MLPREVLEREERAEADGERGGLGREGGAEGGDGAEGGGFGGGCFGCHFVLFLRGVEVASVLLKCVLV